MLSQPTKSSKLSCDNGFIIFIFSKKKMETHIFLNAN